MCCADTVDAIQKELTQTHYSGDTSQVVILLEYTDRRKEETPLYTPYSVAQTVYEALSKNDPTKLFDIQNYIETLPMSKGDSMYSEIATLVGMLKLEGHKKIYLISQTQLPEDKKDKLKAKGVKEIFDLSEATRYISEKPEMKAVMERELAENSA